MVRFPDVGDWNPVNTLTSVVLPAPFGPIRPVTLSRGTSRVTFDRAVRPSKATETRAADSDWLMDLRYFIFRVMT